MNAVPGLAITGRGVVSAAGIGLAALGEALAGTREPCADPTQLPSDEALPEPVRVVPELRIADHLGRKGTRYLDRTSALGLIGTGIAMREAEPSAEWGGTGVVVGSSGGSVRSIGEFARDTLVQERPYLVDPALFPNTVMNSCAGQIAIWNAMRGLNATVAGGHLSTVYAMRYARNAINVGQVRRLLIGAVEELCPQSAWAWRASRALRPEMPIGEGCALFAVEDAEAARSAGRRVFAELLACEVGFSGPLKRHPRVAELLARCIDRALARSGVTPDEVAVVAPGATGIVGLARAEELAVTRALGREVPQVRVKEVTGECFSANGALQLAAVLASPAPAGSVGLVLSVGHDGGIGCLVIRRGEP
jgi:3-oxoacyl-[acyl-carrier-protein] synthase II